MAVAAVDRYEITIVTEVINTENGSVHTSTLTISAVYNISTVYTVFFLSV